MSLEKQIYTPTLKWHQSKDYVYLIFEVHNSKNENILITNNSIYFNVISENNTYEMKFDLLEEIEKENSNYNITEKFVKVILKKVSSDNWKFLTKNRNIYKNNIKINWSEWVDESDEEDNKGGQNDQSQFDFQNMMASMGGMGGMGGMEGMEGMEEMMKGMGGDNEDGNCGDDEDGCDDEDNTDNNEEDDIENNINHSSKDNCDCCCENIVEE